MNSPRVLNGTWKGNYYTFSNDFSGTRIKGEAVMVVAEATNFSDTEYKVKGTFQVATKEPWSFEGTMDGTGRQIYTQASPPVRMSSVLKDGAGKEVGEIYFFIPLNTQNAVFGGEVSNTDSDNGSFEIRR
jgi:hypothetical protein